MRCAKVLCGCKPRMGCWKRYAGGRTEVSGKASSFRRGEGNAAEGSGRADDP